MEALIKRLQTAGDEDSGKYAYKAQRLAFEEDQANKQRQHEAGEAERR